MNKYTEILPQLRDCPECGNDEIKWCSISHRPYCECGNWGATNFGSDQDAINSWNKKTQHEEYLELKDENAALKARVSELEKKNTVLQCKEIMTRLIRADAIRSAKPWVDDCSKRNLDSWADKVERGES